MIRVTLKTGEKVDVESGVRADYVETKEVETTYRVIATTLEVKNSDNRYSGKEIASFRADEVLYFEYIEGEEKEEK